MTPSTAMAADGGARGEANALTASLLGESQGTGTVVATNDGTGEEKTGRVDPPVSVLPDQPFVGLGVLAQDAAATNDGTSEACAGVAGDGGSVIEIGESGCLKPGENIALNLADFDLAMLLEGEAIDGSGLRLPAELTSQLGPITSGLQAGLDEVEAQLGDAGLFIDADAIQAFCTADGQSASGETILTNAGLRLAVPTGGGSQDVKIVNFKTKPAPNTRVVRDLDKVLNLIIDELETAFNDELDPIFSGLGPVLQDLQDDVVTAAITQLRPALVELEKNVVEIILNKQETSQGGKRIDVTGLYLRLLPAAEAAGAPAPLAQIEIANVGCGPMAAAGGTPTDDEGNPVPTKVNAGADTATSGGPSHAGLAAVLASLLALLGVGVLARLTARE